MWYCLKSTISAMNMKMHGKGICGGQCESDPTYSQKLGADWAFLYHCRKQYGTLLSRYTNVLAVRILNLSGKS